MIRLRAEAPSTSHSPLPHIILSHTIVDTPPSGIPPLLPIPAPTSSPSLLLPFTDHGADRPEVCLPPRNSLCFAFGPRYEGDYARSRERCQFGITDTWDEMLVDMPGAPATDDTELGRRMTEFATRVRQDIYEIYVRLDDEQTEGYVTAYYCIGSAGSHYRVAGSGPQETSGNYRVAGSRPQEIGTVH
ncbi:hypothetical protein Tco_1529653 [Tanacetum coccineum]